MRRRESVLREEKEILLFLIDHSPATISIAQYQLQSSYKLKISSYDPKLPHPYQYRHSLAFHLADASRGSCFQLNEIGMP